MKSFYTDRMRLLDRICYLSREPVKAKDLRGNEITVADTFPYNPESKTAPDTARRWADNTRWDHVARQQVKGPDPVFVERANEPFTITITDLDVRSEGGRAYKAVDEEGRRFDLREDQVLEIFCHTGILPGGAVPGEFVWGVLGSQMRMVLVGGDLHTEMAKQGDELKDFKNRQALGMTPTESTLAFGHVYRKRDQSFHVFLGRVKVPGNERALFAFAALPTPPCDHGDEVLDVDRYSGEHGAHLREEREVHRKWAAMTWLERCQWDWYDRNDYLHRQYPGVPPDYYNHPVDIVLMSSPKFEAEVTEDCTDLARQLRANDGAKHKYVNGKGEDLSEERFKLTNGGHERQWMHPRIHGYDFSWYRLSYEEQEKREREYKAKVMADVIATRQQFQKEMVWP